MPPGDARRRALQRLVVSNETDRIGDTQMTYLMIWIGVILIGIIIGKAKGRPGSGFVWSLLLGPIGWLIVLLMKDLREKCPQCGGVIVPGAKKCKNCGSTLGFDPAEYERLKRQHQQPGNQL
jgi:hypothetical protein